MLLGGECVKRIFFKILAIWANYNKIQNFTKKSNFVLQKFFLSQNLWVLGYQAARIGPPRHRAAAATTTTNFSQIQIM